MRPHSRPADAGQRHYRLVAQRILALIGEQGLAPGQRLPPERSLAAMLQVSRSTIREALIALEFDGNVFIAPGSGVYVHAGADDPAAHASAADLADLRAARRLVASEVAALAARHATAAVIDAIGEVVERMEVEGACSADLESAFMRALAGASGNAALAGLIACLWRQRAAPVSAEPAVYRAILKALAAHDGAALRRTPFATVQPVPQG